MRAIARKLQRKLKPSDKVERCGLVLKGGKVPEVANEHFDPARGFKIAAQVLIQNEDRMIGTWHTHPGQSAAFSQDDYQGFCNWPGLTHFIVGADGIRAYEVVDEFVREVDLASD